MKAFADDFWADWVKKRLDKKDIRGTFKWEFLFKVLVKLADNYNREYVHKHKKENASLSITVSLRGFDQ